MSPFHLHRILRAELQLPPAKFFERLRMDRAARALAMHDSRILDIAVQHGYASHETFSRAFRRRFGETPSQFRAAGRLLSNGSPPRPTGRLVSHERGFALSDTRVQATRTLTLAYRRHLGPYEDVQPAMWETLRAQLSAVDATTGALLALAHDDPTSTAPHHLRFDAAIVVDRRLPDIDCQVLAGRLWAATLHVGDYATLPKAYPLIVQQVARLPGYRLAPPPTVEVYHTQQMTTGEVCYTDIYLPIELTQPGC